MPARPAPPSSHRSSISWFGLLLLFCSLGLVAAGADPATVSLATRLVALDTAHEAAVQTGIMLSAYIVQYLVLGGIFEGSHPHGPLRGGAEPARRSRRAVQVVAEIRSGLISLAVTVCLAVGYMTLLEPRTPFYGFFETHEWSVAWGVAGCVAYVAAFDTHFYWSHWLLHEVEYLWQSIHYFHHQYKEPTAFAQFAVHPIEGA